MSQFSTKKPTVGAQGQDASQPQPIVPFQSAAKSHLEEAIDVLDEASALAKKVTPPINSITSGLKQVIDVVDDIETVIKDLNEVITTANAIADIGYALTEIPVVGEVTDVLASGLRSFAEMTDAVLTPLNEFKTTVLDEVKSVIGKIYDVCNKIDGYITYFATNIPVWANTVEVLYFGWKIVSVLIPLLGGTAPADRLRVLLDKFGVIGTTVKTVYGVISEAFEGIFHVVTTILKSICDAIAYFFTHFLQPVIDGIKVVTNAFDKMGEVIHHVKDVFAPVEWLLDAIEWIFEVFVQPIIDDIMDGLHLKALVHPFLQKIEDALHLNDIEKQLEKLFDPKQMGSSNTTLSNHATSASKVHEFATALKDFSSDPTEDLLAAILSAISSTPVIPGSFPPQLPPLPPLVVNHSQQISTQATSMQLSLKVPGRKMKMIPLHRSGSFKPCTVSFVAIAVPKASSSPTDWSDVIQLMNDVDAISNGLQPVLNLGGKLQQFLCKAQQQMGMPEDLHNQLIKLSDVMQFLHDLSQFLQMFPIFKPFLTPLTASLSDEIQAIGKLDTGMSQLVQATSDLSVSIKPIVDASSPTLTATINQLSNSLKNWKQQADKYCKLLQQYYAKDKTKKFKPRIDAIVTTFHQRIAQLQTILNDVKGLVKQSGDEGNTIATSLDTVGVQFDKLDPSVSHLEELIQKVGEVARLAAKLDGIFKPLKFMLQTHKCVGDQNEIKAGSLKAFQMLTDLSNDPTVTQTFKTLFEDAMNHFFPVQTVAGLVKDSGAAVTAASTSIAKIQSNYLQVLQSIEKIQVGPYQFKHYNPKTKKTETINNHFFTDAEVQEILQLGKDMN